MYKFAPGDRVAAHELALYANDNVKRPFGQLVNMTRFAAKSYCQEHKSETGFTNVEILLAAAELADKN